MDTLRAVAEVAAYVETLWRDGIWPDEAPQLRARLVDAGDDPASDELRLFGCCYELMCGVSAPVPMMIGEVETLIVLQSARVIAGVLARDPASVDVAIGELGNLLDQSAPEHPHFAPARAWADLALGEVALAIPDPATAARRFAALAEEAMPPALRITAFMRTATFAVAGGRIELAKVLAEEAIAILKVGNQPNLEERRRIGWGLLETLADPPTRKRKHSKAKR